MLVKQELIGKIRDYFDLNIYETKVWLALLSKGSASAGEIASLSGVPRSRTYDVLETLEKKGFALAKLGKPVKYLGVKPHIVLEKMKNNVRKEAEDRVVSLSNIKNSQEFSLLEGLYTEGLNPVKREDLSASLKGRSNISNHLRDLIENAEKEVIVCTNANEMKQKEKLFQETFELLRKNKIKIKVALSGDDALIKEISDKFRIKIKKVNLDAKFFIIDRTQVLFYLSKDSTKNDQAVWLNSDFFAESFGSLFDMALKI
jgi:HTH-type transcriptional regulator, sugar sensing transcriptional regulator